MEQYYKKRDGIDYAVPKGTINKSINPYDPSTYQVHLENMDYPYIIDEWERTREYCVKNNIIECVFPKYIAKMNLAAYKKFTWKNTEKINQTFNNSKFIYNDLERLGKNKMTNKEFLKRYDKKKLLTENELKQLWQNELLDETPEIVRGEEYSIPGRWNIPIDKVIKVEDRYFMIYCYQAATEYQEDEYNWQPDEVYPVERTVICWEGFPQDV